MDILIPLAGLVGSLALSSVLVAGLVDLVYGADGRSARSRRAEARERAELRAHVRALASTAAVKRSHNRAATRWPKEVCDTGIWIM